MKTLVSIAFLATILSFCRPGSAAQKGFPASPRSEDSWLSAVQRAEIDHLFARPPKSPGYAVAIIKDAGFALRKGYGLADLDDGVPITPETSFHLASLSKQFTGASHQSFAAFMHERVFGPLGMAHTEIDDDTTEVIPHRATGYAPRNDPKVVRELASVGVLIKPGNGWVRLIRVSPPLWRQRRVYDIG